jgi:serine protease Do
VAVTVVEFEPDRPRRVAQGSEPQAAPQPKTAIGLAVSDLTEAQKRELKLRGGVRVESVEGAAARAGLREGDVIVTLDNAEVVDAKQFNAQVAKLDKAKPASVMVRRGDWTNYLVIRPTAR